MAKDWSHGTIWVKYIRHQFGVCLGNAWIAFMNHGSKQEQSWRGNACRFNMRR
jgi:hypothetical protein